MSQNGQHEYPNVEVRLRLSRKGPGLPARENYMDIWMKGTRFRVRDESGRHSSEILRDVSAGSGLGASPHSMEDIMDIWSQSQRPVSPKLTPTEFYGDVATNEGWVYRGDQEPWAIAAKELAPAAEQILERGSPSQLERRGDVTFLRRKAVEYQGHLDGEGVSYNSDVTRIVSPPFVLLNSVRDANNANHYYISEVVSLEENTVTDEELTPSLTSN